VARESTELLRLALPDLASLDAEYRAPAEAAE
jgi:hypothetical protein